MKAEFSFTDYRNLEATLSVKMKISEWMELNEQLATGWPSWKLGAAIREMISKAQLQLESKGKISE